MEQQKKHQDYVFCYNEYSPTSLVMLHQSDKILQLLLVSPEQTVFIWVDDNIIPQLQVQMQTIQKQLQMQIVKYNSLSSFLTHVHQNRFMRKLLVICPPQLTDKVIKLNNIKRILCYPAQGCESLYQQSYLIYYIENQESLKDILISQKNISNKLEYKWLPNFFNLNQEISTSNISARSLWAMINSANDSQTKGAIINQLSKLMTQIERKQQKFYGYYKFFQQFIQQLKKGQMSLQRSIYWYTLQSPIFKLINNLLRSTQQPCLIFYIQPYFKCLYNSISTLHKQQKYKRKFICYRGGQITQEEVKRLQNNLGGIVQNLGFLSTSLDREVTQEYIKNALFQIIVCQQKIYDNWNFGYANISEYSKYFSQSEILFNPLNFFKIISIKEKTNQESTRFQILLQYKGNQFQEDKMPSENQKLNNLIIKMQNDEKTAVKSQGSALVISGQNYKQSQQQGLIYWEKYIEIVQLKYQKMNKIQTNVGKIQKSTTIIPRIQQISNLMQIYTKGLKYLAWSYQNKGQYQKALKIFEQYQQILAKYYRFKDYVYIDALNRLGNIHKFLKNFDKSLEFYSKSQQLIIQIFGVQHYQNSIIIDHQANILGVKLELNKALNLYQESMRIKQKCFGLNNYQSLQTIYGIATIYKSKEEFSKALQLYCKLLKITKNIYGFAHLFYADTLQNISSIYHIKGQLQKSLHFLQETLFIKQICYGYDHPGNAITLTSMANVFYQRNQYQSALQYCYKSQQILKKFKEQKTILFINNLIYIAHIHYSKNEMFKALNIYQKAKQIFFDTYGQNHYTYANLLLSIANIHFKRQEIDYALQLYLKAQKIIYNSLEKSKMIYTNLLNNIAAIHFRKGKFEQALIFYQKSLQIKCLIYGSSHYLFIPTLSNIGNMNLMLGNFTKALLTYHQSKILILKYHGTHHSKFADLLYYLTFVYEFKGDFKTAQNLQSKSLILKKKLFGENHKQHLLSLIRYARIYKNKGSFQKALKFCKYVFRILKEDISSLYRFQSFKDIIQIYAQSFSLEIAPKNHQKILLSYIKGKSKKKFKILLHKKKSKFKGNLSFLDF